MPLPAARGLYDPRHERDACGLGFVAETRAPASHDVVERALVILERLAHRGAMGADPASGDGAGILLQIPHAYYERVLAHAGRELPLPGDYGVAMCFLSRDDAKRAVQMHTLERMVRYHNQKVIGWRTVPVDPACIGPVARAQMPHVAQLFVARMGPLPTFERTLFMIRKRTGRELSRLGVGEDFYVASFSSRTVVYKGLMLPERIRAFYTDLAADDVVSKLALVHSRFSTNTFPTWERAHPYRRIAHNGEINTLRGNQNWMSAREALLASRAFGEHLADMKPIIRPGGSDSASLDNVVDFLIASGRSVAHVMMMLVPEAWVSDPNMDPDVRAFYEYHAALVEPWDGPAALVFTDGESIGAMLDRNGLRPARWLVTQGGMVVLSSEAGVVDVPPETVVQRGRLSPGRMLLVDTKRGRIIPDEETKRAVSTRQPYAEWLADHKIELRALPGVAQIHALSAAEARFHRRAFAYTREDIEAILLPMAKAGEEPVGSMGADIPLAVLSERAVPLYRYFKQQFAQVTNPPIDPIREDLVVQLTSFLGGEGNLLEETPSQCRLVELPHPILSSEELAKLARGGELGVRVLPALFDARRGGAALEEALSALVERAEREVDAGAGVLVISDRGVDEVRAAIPSLLAVAAVHHHLVRAGKRAKTGIVAEAGDAREVADLALLIGYGAGAVSPYLAFETVAELARSGALGDLDVATAQGKYVKAVKKGLLKVMSKMGISALSSYHGAQIFEAIGVSRDVCDRYFTGTSSPVGGVDLPDVADAVLANHAAALAGEELEAGGVYAFRREGERHLWNPTSIAALQKAVRTDSPASYEEYARSINDQSRAQYTLRGLLDLVPAGPPVPLDEVEPAVEIVKRFATGAMSFGSISREAHETLAIAMNRIGGKSNTGEGGEDEARLVRDARGDSKRSAIKQVASGRFGVTAHYLASADEIQIKMAQGAKPGEGGQLPGHKVSVEIAKVRHSTPGVTLISPPPHHDIYSIEDLAQLIFDLKNVNPRARVSVKLVSESGVGTVAAGVAKAHADVILVAGHDGGTGASPLSSIQHAGTPWEIGLAEAQQVLVMNGLRGRVVLQADGQMKTGRDVAVAALLGAEEFGFATAPLVATGCVMMRKCHLNTCPVGVATQDPVLRKRFQGQPEHVVRYFFFVAEELRAIMASLGFRAVTEMVGRADCLRQRVDAERPSKASKLDFSRILTPSRSMARRPERAVLSKSPSEEQDHGLAGALDEILIGRAFPALDRAEPVRIEVAIANKHRAVGAMLSGEIARRHGGKGLREATIVVQARGSAGQSFGAFAAPGLVLELEGEANDYVGKGLSGGIVAVRPPREATYAAHENVIVGNTVLYGATSGRAFFAGRAGERFCVRNSGAHAVVEGTGDHGCEYMTGGVAVVLGSVGRNFGAGMSGGLAFVLDEEGRLPSLCNPETIALCPLDDPDDLELVRALLLEHQLRTKSVRAAEILGSFEKLRPRFVKVFPHEYRRVLEERRGAEPTRKVVGHG